MHATVAAASQRQLGLSALRLGCSELSARTQPGPPCTRRLRAEFVEPSRLTFGEALNRQNIAERTACSWRRDCAVRTGVGRSCS